MKLESPAFKNGAEIPVRYTFQGSDINRGQDISPPLAWYDLPEDTKSFALIVEDPDAPDPAHPEKTFVHWVVFDIPATVRGFPEGVRLLAPVRQGFNGWNQIGYGGPHPPIGTHRYFFKLYALDVATLNVDKKKPPQKKEIEDAMWGHILAETSLMGTYQLKKSSR
ncbi:MAG: YbhB/YbcL family Raf kinase inhibitor-like protein [Alphaproteobacteria bacterium]|nr:YbhB/YbcL family Raf kinase inhibitor-like protein [Alphaproteobacteria bacterium]